MNKCLFGIILLFVLGLSQISYAQLLPPDRAEQDACGALVLDCGTSFHTPYSYDGEGWSQDMPFTPCGSGEGNSMWIRINVVTGGTLQFTINPVVVSDDYDFAVINATNVDCDNLNSSNVVRCNFNKNSPITNQGRVGLGPSGQLDFVQAGTAGQNFARSLNVLAGQSYLIMINNFGGDGGPSSGFTIDFAGSTAVFSNNERPKLEHTGKTCFSVTDLIVDLNKYVLCSSIAPNGSDFTISSGNVVAATGVNCNSSNQGYTNQLSLTISPVLGPGTYVLKARVGSDNNTIIDLCGNALALPDSLVFTVVQDDRVTTRDSMVGCGFVEYRGRTYTESINVIDTIRTAHGCDSIYVTMKLTVYPNTPTIKPVDFNGCDSVVFRGQTYRQSTTVRDTFFNYLGCDSVVVENNINIQNFGIFITADPPEPVIGDLVRLQTTASQDDYQVNAWLPTSYFNAQTTKENAFIIRQSDTIKVVATSPFGCVDTTALYLKADTLKPFVFMPNAFTPNNDGLNDLFEAYFYSKSGYRINSFRIFNRWGQMVYMQQAVKKVSWDGTGNNGKPADAGVYYCYIDIEFIDGTKTVYSGDVTLLR